MSRSKSRDRCSGEGGGRSCDWCEEVIGERRVAETVGQGGQVGVGKAIGRGEKEDQIGGGGGRMRIGEEVGGR